MLVPNNLTWINQTVLNIWVVPSRFSDQNDLKILRWTVIDFKPTFLLVKIEFEDPVQVSKSNPKDDLSIKFVDSNFFISESSFEIIKNNTLLTKQIPKQMALDKATAMLQSAGAPAKSTMSTVMFGNMALNIIM